MSAAQSDTPAPSVAWRTRAEELADWAIARVFVRTDRFGGYYRKDGETRKSARPNRGCATPFDRNVAVRHFKARGAEAVIGAYPLTAGEGGTGRWVGIDIDCHDEGDDPDRNRRYAEHLYHKLTALGFRPLACHWGTGGYHVWVFLSDDVPGAALFAFARWVVMDATADPWNYPKPVETFPKQAAVPAGKFGNWLRLVGRHHTLNRFAAVFDGKEWVQGEPAVALVLACTGDPPDLIPAEARPTERAKAKSSANGRHEANGKAGKARVPTGGPDVFAAYNATVTLDVVVGWHEARGHKVTRREPGRVEFVRAGKEGGGQSFNVQDVGGVPITYNFSTNAGIPDHEGLTPSRVRCLYQFGACDTAAMRRFAGVLRAELGWEASAAGTGTPAGPQPSPGAGSSTEATTAAAPHTPSVGERFSDTDLANARRFVSDHGGTALFVADWGRWYVWDGQRWAVDRTGSIVARLAHQTLRKMADAAAERVAAAAKRIAAAACEAEEVAAEREKQAADRDLAWAKKSQDAKKVAAMVEMARPYLLVREGAEVFDTQPHLLNCPNGTVDLRTGQIRPHSRDDHLTKLCPTRYDPSAEAPAYKAFLAAVLPDPAVAGYARELSGSAVTGEVSDQTLHLFKGRGSNGKGVLLDIWVEVLGDGEYAATAPAELVADGGENRHPTEKTVLRGARLAACQETADGEVLNAKRVKHLTGGSRIIARGMRQDFFTFAPTHTLILATNYLPRVRTNDHATWRRIRLVEFPVTFWTEADRKAKPEGDYPDHLRADPGLPDRLRAEKEGVLADMVAHAVEFYANGCRLDPPRQVMQAVADYRGAEDVLARFFEGWAIDPEDKAAVRGGEFYRRFVQWYRAEIDPEGKDMPGSRTFGEAADAKFGRKKIGGYMIYRVIPAGPRNARPGPRTASGRRGTRTFTGGEGGEGGGRFRGYSP